MEHQASRDTGPKDYKGYRTIRYRLKVIFSCLTAFPFVVFAFLYFRIGTFNTALSASLIALALILVLEGFIVFRKMAEHAAGKYMAHRFGGPWHLKCRGFCGRAVALVCGHNLGVCAAVVK